MRLTGKPTIIEFDPFSTEAGDAQTLGEPVYLGDQRIFRYSKVGAANTSPGKLELAPAPKTNHHNMTLAAAAVGATSITVTLGATAAVADEYDEGFLAINAGPGNGEVFKVYYQPAIASAGTGVITVDQPLPIALTSSSKGTLVHNAQNGVVEAAAQTRRAAGVGLIAGTAANFVYLQTRGVASVLADGAVALGSWIVGSGAVAGAVTAVSGTYATGLATEMVGQASILAGVDTEYRPMFLSID